jgi:hypothetical protein
MHAGKVGTREASLLPVMEADDGIAQFMKPFVLTVLNNGVSRIPAFANPWTSVRFRYAPPLADP